MDFRFIALAVYFSTFIRVSFPNCTHDIPHGEVTWWCETNTGSSCPYSCDEGYEENDEAHWISCSSSGEWLPMRSPTNKDLCSPKSCPDMIPNGQLLDDCSGKVGTTCEYSCNMGYQKNTTVSTISCEPSTNWSANPHSLCTSNRQCSYEVDHGDLDLSCQRLPGESCNFTCHEGYLPSQTLSSSAVTCESSLVWSQPLTSLCEKILCPSIIPNGVISSYCSREYKEYCRHYDCDTGYTKPEAEPNLRCNASGQWYWDKHQGNPCARNDDICPSEINNGHIIWHCHRQHGATCTYDCDSGCTEDRSRVWLDCESNSKWDTNTDTLCTCEHEATSTASTAATSTTTVTTVTTIPILCSDTVPNGHIDPGCNRSPFVMCSYTCNGGCDNNYRSLYCTGQGYWNNGETACSCYGEPETTSTTSVAATSTTTTAADPYLCSDTIPNGHISRECNRRPFSTCGYSCNDRCFKNYISLYCMSRAYWNNGKSACICNDEHVTSTTYNPNLCSSFIPNGEISRTCSREQFSSCNDYTCFNGCHNMLSLYCTSFGTWSNEWSACSCQGTNSPPTPDSTNEGFNSTPVIIGVIIAVVAMSFVSVICCIWFRKTRQQSPPNIYYQPSSNYNRPELTGTNNNGTSNRGLNPVHPLQNQTNLYTSIQQQGNTEENLYTQLQPATGELNINISKPPEYSSIAELEPKEDPPAYELVISNPSDFKV